MVFSCGATSRTVGAGRAIRRSDRNSVGWSKNNNSDETPARCLTLLYFRYSLLATGVMKDTCRLEGEGESSRPNRKSTFSTAKLPEYWTPFSGTRIVN